MMKNRTALLWIFALLVFPDTALAAWGENWGEMVWGLPVSVPSVPGIGLIALAIALSVAAAWTLRKRRTALGLPVLLVLLALPLVVVAGTVTAPNTFVNSENRSLLCRSEILRAESWSTLPTRASAASAPARARIEVHSERRDCNRPPRSDLRG